MFRFDCTNTDYEALIQDLAREMRARICDHQLVLPADYGDGFINYLKLPNGLHAALYKITWQKDWMFHSEKSPDEFYTLRFEELISPGTLIMTIDGQKITERGTTKYLTYLSSSLSDWSYEGTAGAYVRGVSIIFSKKWLANYLDISTTEDALSAYIELKADNISIEPLDAQYRIWLNTICDTDNTDPLRMTIIQNRIMLMMERFFQNLIRKMQNPALRVNLAPEDMRRVMHIESILTENIYQLPPSIQQLAKIASVSESKLKKDFKTLYNSPIYEYYQKVRMKAARDKLLTGEFSVKEVAMELGYANLSNFTVAFKKEFGLLPSTLLDRGLSRG